MSFVTVTALAILTVCRYTHALLTSLHFWHPWFIVAVKNKVLLYAVGKKKFSVLPFLGLPLFNWPQKKLLGVKRVRETSFNIPGFSYC